MPSPAEAAAAAVEYLQDAADRSSGHALGRALKSLAEALSFLAGVREESYDREILLAARKAFDVLDPLLDPLGRLYTLRILHSFGEVALPDGLPGLLPVPLSVVRARQGKHEASCVFAEALTLADRIAVMYRSELRQVGTPRELMTAPADDYVAKLIGMAKEQADQLAELTP